MAWHGTDGGRNRTDGRHLFFMSHTEGWTVELTALLATSLRQILVSHRQLIGTQTSPTT